MNMPILKGLDVSLEVVNHPQLGKLKTLTVFCDKETANKVMTEGVKRGYPHQRFDGGIKLFA